MGKDLRSAIRSLWSNRGFTIAALIVLTLAIGATTAIFSVADAVLLRGLPFDEDHRLVAGSAPRGAGDVRRAQSRSGAPDVRRAPELPRLARAQAGLRIGADPHIVGRVVPLELARHS